VVEATSVKYLRIICSLGLQNVVGDGNKKSVINKEHMDMEAYGSPYNKRMNIMHLIFIADHCGNDSMRLEAL